MELSASFFAIQRRVMSWKGPRMQLALKTVRGVQILAR